MRQELGTSGSHEEKPLATTVDEIHSLVERLSPQEQQRVLDYIRELAQSSLSPHSSLPPGTPPDVLLRMTVPPEIGEAMQKAIEDCERIEEDE